MDKAERWQKLFREKGWWDGSKVTEPRGFRLQLQILCGDSPDTVDVSQIVQITEFYIEYRYGGNWIYYYSWDDIVRVDITKR